MSKQKPKAAWKNKLHEIIYEADTPAGKLFDVVLLFVILLSIVLVMLESVDYIGTTYFSILDSLEWIITILFTLEYIARIVCVKNPKAYIFSFYGIIDFLSTVPKYLSLFIVGTHHLCAINLSSSLANLNRSFWPKPGGPPVSIPLPRNSSMKLRMSSNCPILFLS